VKRILSVFFIVLNCLYGFSQVADYTLQTRRFSNAVWIRWIPQNPESFASDVINGYSLQRITVSRDGKALESEERYQLNGEPIRWDTLNQIQDTMQVLKQVFFFRPGHTDNVQEMLRNIEMQRLSWLQANLWLMKDFRLAVNCGLGWVDFSAKINETYLYELRVWKDTGIVKGAQYAGLYDEPAIPQLTVKKEKGRNTLLRVNHSEYYWGYIIEKAADSISAFKALSELPFVNGSKSDELWVSDTQILQSGQAYYRVCGIDPFGLRGPWSDTVSIWILPEIHCPAIEDLRMINDTLFTFRWNLHENLLPLIKSSGISYSSAVDEVFQPLNIQKNSAGWQASWPAGYTSVYLRPHCTDLNDISHHGPVAFLQPIDSIPPAEPEIIKTHCDSVGVVTIRWKSVQGAAFYRLYRGNYRNTEFTDHSHQYFADTFYSDTIDLKTLQDTVFYAVTALDSRYNESKQRPAACAVFDIIPPPPPAFLSYVLVGKGYQLRWSQSHDAAFYILHRQGEQELHLQIDSAFFWDTTANSGGIYTYYLTATDRNANISEASAKLTLQFPAIKNIPSVSSPICLNDSQKRNCYVFWDYPEYPGISHFRIMLLSNGRKRTVGTAKANERQFCFYGFLKQKEEEFQIIAYTKDGLNSR
jgi:hypothetical protein